MTQTDWTPEEKIEAKQMFLKGMTFTQIADVMGKTRSAVAGKLNRMGLKRSDLRKVDTLKPRELPPVKPINSTVNLRDAKPNQCRYIAGTDGMICGKETVRHQMCHEHVELCYRKVETRNSTNERIIKRIETAERNEWSVF